MRRLCSILGKKEMLYGYVVPWYSMQTRMLRMKYERTTETRREPETRILQSPQFARWRRHFHCRICIQDCKRPHLLDGKLFVVVLQDLQTTRSSKAASLLWQETTNKDNKAMFLHQQKMSAQVFKKFLFRYETSPKKISLHWDPWTFTLETAKDFNTGIVKKKGISRVTWLKTSVEEKIACIDDEDKKRCCLRAYNHLMKTKESSYSKFVAQREAALPSSRGINLYHYQDGDAIECALWPNLYPYTSWCESVVKGQTTRESSKVAFMKKLLSEVIDYNLSY